MLTVKHILKSKSGVVRERIYPASEVIRGLKEYTAFEGNAGSTIPHDIGLSILNDNAPAQFIAPTAFELTDEDSVAQEYENTVYVMNADGKTVATYRL